MNRAKPAYAAIALSILVMAHAGCTSGDLSKRNDYTLAPKTWGPEARKHYAAAELDRALNPNGSDSPDAMSSELRKQYEDRQRQSEFEKDLAESRRKTKHDDFERQDGKK